MSVGAQVLVLNKAWVPVSVVGVERAFGLLYAGVAKALDSEYQLFDYDSWSDLSADLRRDDVIHTSELALKVPRILVLQVYDKFPKKHIRFSRNNIYARDGFTCQYCGVKFSRTKLNLDHVVPRCQGGKTSWENVCCSCYSCNLDKGGRTPEQAGMRLLRKPKKPSVIDSCASRSAKYEEWKPFIDPASAAYWGAELVDDA